MEVMRIKPNSLNILILAVCLILGQTSELALALCPQFFDGIKVGTVAHSLLDEVSGIAASRHSPGVIWAHNDAGGLPRLWAFNTRGTHLGTYNLTTATARDWEDMAIGPGPVLGTDYFYVADLGNNDALIDFTFTIYRVPEPALSACQTPADLDVNGVVALPVRYPDSVRHGCETFLADPLTGDLYVCTRDRWGDDLGVMKVYRYPAPQNPGLTFTLQHVTDVPLINGEMAVGGDVSLDGSSVIIRTKGTVMRVLLWQRSAATPLWQAFSNPMCVLPQVDEPQGEAVCFKADGCGYYTISEDLNQPIYYFELNGPCPMPTITGDLNWDGHVDITDLALLASHWLTSCLTCSTSVTLDDFESYDDTVDLESQWSDNVGSPTQTLETQETYLDAKAMKIDYAGDTTVTIRSDLGTPQNWTSFDNANIQFKGRVSNKPRDIILTLTTAASQTAASATFTGGTKERYWTMLDITLNPADPLLQTIRYVDLTINAQGQSGTVYFDQLELIPTEPLYSCITPIAEDLAPDCWIDMFDFSKLAANWQN